ncbi:hypothetical protein ES708_25332 [subsurface metagenome]
MNLPKAIAIKKRYQYILTDASLPELIEADNISIEALIVVISNRNPDNPIYIGKLPGETKD